MLLGGAAATAAAMLAYPCPAGPTWIVCSVNGDSEALLSEQLLSNLQLPSSRRSPAVAAAVPLQLAQAVAAAGLRLLRVSSCAVLGTAAGVGQRAVHSLMNAPEPFVFDL